MKKVVMSFLTLSLCLFALTAWADTLEMKDGELVEGRYLGGTQYSIRFQVNNQVKVFSVKDVLALTFSFSGASSPQAQAPQPKVTPTPPMRTQSSRRGEITLEPGTKLAVRMLESLYLENSQKNDWFRGTLESDVIVDGTTIFPKGSSVNGQVVTAEQGKYGSTLAITVREITVDNQIIPVATSNYMVQDEAQNVLDLGISTLKIVTRDRDVQIPYRSVIEFETTEAIRFRRAK